MTSHTSAAIAANWAAASLEMMLIVLVNVLIQGHHLVLAHLIGAKDGMAASLAAALGALVVVLEPGGSLRWNDASLASVHLDLGW